MKLKNLFAITAIASALVLTGCKEEKKADAASTAPAATSIKVGVMAGPEHQVAETAAKVAKDKYNLNVEFVDHHFVPTIFLTDVIFASPV